MAGEYCSLDRQTALATVSLASIIAAASGGSLLALVVSGGANSVEDATTASSPQLASILPQKGCGQSTGGHGQPPSLSSQVGDVDQNPSREGVTLYNIRQHKDSKG